MWEEVKCEAELCLLRSIAIKDSDRPNKHQIEKSFFKNIRRNYLSLVIRDVKVHPKSNFCAWKIRGYCGQYIFKKSVISKDNVSLLIARSPVTALLCFESLETNRPRVAILSSTSPEIITESRKLLNSDFAQTDVRLSS